jgi:transposase
MWYVGLDAHTKQSTFCVLNANGQRQFSRQIKGPWDKVLFELAGIKQPFAVCFEASTGYGYLHERLSRIAQRVVVAHPGQLRLIFRSKRKNDRVDAEKLAKLLYLDEVPPVYVPTADVQAWRAMIEHRERLLAERTRAKNSLRAGLRSQGLTAPKGLWTQRGLAWLRALPETNFLNAMRRDIGLERVASLNQMLKRSETGLAKMAATHPGVALLMSIPGVGIRTAEAVVAYIDDPGRFGRNKTIGSYFGLVPSQDSSAGKNRLGHITRQGPATVRRLLTEAAWQGVRRSPQIRAYFERIHQGDPERRKIALAACAHYLLRVMLAMLKTGELWRHSAA